MIIFSGDNALATKCVSFSCPLCKTGYEIFLRDVPFLMIMDCPHCKSTLSCFEGEIRVVTPSLINEIKNAKTHSEIKTTFMKFEQSEKPEHIKTRVFDEDLTKDKVTNLVIDLELCKTFEDVMKVVDAA